MERRHDLDWLRVLLFALLVPHHAAVGFVEWGEGIYGLVNDRLAGDRLGLAIYFSHSWRLPSLFLIAGIGTWFATSRGAGARFIGSRAARLLVPAIFGTFVLNATYGYALHRAGGAPPGFLAFWSDWLLAPETRQVGHLWFLVNLTLYAIFAWPLFAARARLASREPAVPILLAGLVAASALAVALVKPHAAALAGDGYQFLYYLTIFAGGFLIGAWHRAVLAWTARNVLWLLAAAIAAFIAKITLLGAALDVSLDFGAALARGGWVPLGLGPAVSPLTTGFSVAEAVTAWAWCLAALGLAARYLDRPGRLLSVLAPAVFPLYVLHFPVILIGLALLTRTTWPWQLEFLLLTFGTFLIVAVLYRAALLTGPLVYLIGGRPRRRAARPDPERPPGLPR